jgi:phage-related protein
MGNIVVAVFNGIKSVAEAVFHWIANNWPLLLGILLGPFSLAAVMVATHIGTIKALVSGIPGHVLSAMSTVAGYIAAPFVDAYNGVTAAVGNIISFVGGIPGQIVGALGDVGNILYGAGKSIIEGLGKGITDAFDAVKNTVSGFAGKIASLKGPLDRDRALLVPAGNAIMEGLGRGLDQGFGRFVAPSLDNTVRAIAAAGGSSRGGLTPATSYAGRGRSGPLVNIEHATFSDAMDAESFGRQLAWNVSRAGV